MTSLESNLHITETDQNNGMIPEKTKFDKSIFFDSELDTLVLIYTKLYCGAFILLLNLSR